MSVWHQILTRGSSRRLEVFCERAFLWADDDHLGPLHLETAGGSEAVVSELPEWVPALGLPDELVAPLAQYAAPAKGFLDALACGTAADPGRAPDAATALAAHRLVDLAYRSAASGGAPQPVPGAAPG